MRKNNQGFSLIEILISLVIVSVGMIGLGGLHITSVKEANNAHYRTEAALLVADLTERIRTNPDGVVGGFYDVQGEIGCSANIAQCLPSSNGLPTTPCSPQQKAAADLDIIACGVKRGNRVSGGVENLLPSGTLTVNEEPNNAIVTRECRGITPCLRILVAWQETEDKNQNSNHANKNITQWLLP